MPGLFYRGTRFFPLKRVGFELPVLHALYDVALDRVRTDTIDMGNSRHTLMKAAKSGQTL